MRRIFGVISALALVAGVSVVGVTVASAQTVCATTAQFGECSYPPYDINNNLWNPVSGSAQTLTATSANDWNISATEPDTSGVKTYPEIQENYTDSVGSLTTVQQNFSVTPPAVSSGTSWEIAADDWLNGTPGNDPNGDIEIMVWYDVNNTSPAGSNTGKTLTVGNRTFDLWANTGADPTYTLVSQETVISGTVNFVDYLNFLKSLGYVADTDTLVQLNFGEEILSTNSSPETFTFTKYNNVVDTGATTCAT
jgi:Glycosyl hydrolase family 12